MKVVKLRTSLHILTTSTVGVSSNNYGSGTILSRGNRDWDDEDDDY